MSRQLYLVAEQHRLLHPQIKPCLPFKLVLAAWQRFQVMNRFTSPDPLGHVPPLCFSVQRSPPACPIAAVLFEGDSALTATTANKSNPALHPLSPPLPTLRRWCVRLKPTASWRRSCSCRRLPSETARCRAPAAATQRSARCGLVWGLQFHRFRECAGKMFVDEAVSVAAAWTSSNGGPESRCTGVVLGVHAVRSCCACLYRVQLLGVGCGVWTKGWTLSWRCPCLGAQCWQ